MMIGRCRGTGMVKTMVIDEYLAVWILFQISVHSSSQRNGLETEAKALMTSMIRLDTL